jgi:hypothetical protein
MHFVTTPLGLSIHIDVTQGSACRVSASLRRGTRNPGLEDTIPLGLECGMLLPKEHTLPTHESGGRFLSSLLGLSCPNPVVSAGQSKKSTSEALPISGCFLIKKTGVMFPKTPIFRKLVAIVCVVAVIAIVCIFAAVAVVVRQVPLRRTILAACLTNQKSEIRNQNGGQSGVGTSSLLRGTSSGGVR